MKPLKRCDRHQTTPLPTAEEIYYAYPKHVAKPKAVQKIEAACRKICAACLLELTKAYADVRSGEDPRFTPHPATWFFQERFNDDPSTWTNAPVNHRNSGFSVDERTYGKRLAEVVKARNQNAVQACAQSMQHRVGQKVDQLRLL